MFIWQTVSFFMSPHRVVARMLSEYYGPFMGLLFCRRVETIETEHGIDIIVCKSIVEIDSEKELSWEKKESEAVQR
jgi:hypothetical protein